MLRPMRRPLVAVMLVAAGLSGCGGGPSDSQQVQATVDAFARASAAKDYQRLCDSLLSPALVEEVETAGLPCEVALRQGLGDVEAPTLTIGRIEVDGDKATARVNSAARGQPPSRDTLQLERVGDSWRIASLR
jgi:ketosteroid isomerase-like protein